MESTAGLSDGTSVIGIQTYVCVVVSAGGVYSLRN